MATRICNLLVVHPDLWRFIGFVSSLVGLICYAASPPFTKLFECGEVGLLVIVIYCAAGSVVCCTMLCTTTWGLTKSTVLTAHVVFFVLMVTSVYSFYIDKTEQGKQKKESDKVLNLISCGAFSLMSLCLSRLTGLGFEVGMSNFFLGSVMMAVMKWNIKFAIAAATFCYILVNVRTYSDSLLETNNQSRGSEEAEVALIENGYSRSNEHHRPRPVPHELRPEIVYDVFISFRGKDTSDIPEYLACALLRKSLRIYAHEELMGDSIPPTVVGEIERTKVLVIILSESYLDAAWCLDELHKVMECRARYARIVIPVFYNVGRAAVYPKFLEVVRKHKLDSNKATYWSSDLKEAITLQGWEMKGRRPYELLEDVACHALSHCKPWHPVT